MRTYRTDRALFLLCLAFFAGGARYRHKDRMEDTAAAVSSGGNPAAPATFEQAFAADASPAPDPSTQTTDAAAAEQPTAASEASPQQADERSPFIPRPRFDEVNTERNELKQWKEQYAWAEQVNRDQLAQVQQLAEKYTRDKLGFLNELAQEIQSDPVLGPQLRSMAARTLAAARGQQAPAADAEPQLETIPVELQDGRVVQFVTADSQQKREQWLQRQWLAQAEQKFAPVVQTVEQVKAERAAAEQRAQVEQFATTTFADVQTWPGMDNADTRKAVADALKGMALQSDDPREVALALNAAYRKVVVPTLSRKAESSLLDSLQQKAAASTSVNPGSAASSTPKSYKSFTDLPPEAWR